MASSNKECSTRRQLFLSNSPVKKHQIDDDPIVIDVPLVQTPNDLTPPSSPVCLQLDEAAEDKLFCRTLTPCPPTPNRPKVVSRSPALVKKDQKKVKVARRMSDQCGTLHVNYKNDMDINAKIAASTSVPDLRVTPEEGYSMMKPSGTPLRVLRYKTNVNPFSPSRGYPTAKGEFQIPTEREAIPRYISDFEQHHELGKGSYGTVVLCLNRTDGWTYAIKKLTYTSERTRNKFLQEAYALAALGQHPNIVRYYGSWEEKTISAIYIQFEWCKGGSLKNYLPSTWTQITLCNILRQVCLALSYIHARGFSHGDVKPENILVDSPTIDNSSIFKLCDFGQINGSGDGQYLAPEILLYNEEYLKTHPTVPQKADVFSLGISIYELACTFSRNGNYFDSKFNPIPMIRSQITATDIVLPEEHFSRDFLGLLKDMMSRDYDERLSADQILGHFLVRENFGLQLLEQEKRKVYALQEQIKQLERDLAKAKKHRAGHKRPNKSNDMLDLKRNLNEITLAPPSSSIELVRKDISKLFPQIISDGMEPDSTNENFSSPLSHLQNTPSILIGSPPAFSPSILIGSPPAFSPGMGLGLGFSYTSPTSKNP